MLMLCTMPTMACLAPYASLTVEERARNGNTQTNGTQTSHTPEAVR